jgi:hypothetical protein
VPKPMRHLIRLARLRPFRNAYLRRGIAVWVLARLALAWARVHDPGVPTELALLGVVALAVWMDARRRSEDVFLGNLGIPSWTIAVLASPLAALAELLVP